jgi:hypothetical protein
MVARYTVAGYPNHGPHPLWYAEPPWITKMILLELCGRVNKNPAHGNKEVIKTSHLVLFICRRTLYIVSTLTNITPGGTIYSGV